MAGRAGSRALAADAPAGGRRARALAAIGAISSSRRALKAGVMQAGSTLPIFSPICLAAVVTVPLQRAVKGGEARVTLPTGRTLDVKIPAGVEAGQQIRLRGQGQPSAMGGRPGDVILTVEIAPHPAFKVDGRDLRLDLPVTLYEAALGGSVQAPTLDGLVELSLPPGSAGKTLRLRGKGLPKSGDKAAGDLFVTPRIALPEATDPEFEALMKRWRTDKPYDPRKGM